MSRIESLLLIEDNPGDVRLVREYIADRFGDRCRVRSAGTLAEGLHALRDAPVDVVLLDLGLPDSEGLETFYRVQAQAPRTPVVIFTGHDDDEQAVEALRVGAEDYLAKQQADSVGLVRTLRHAVQRRKSADALRDSEARFRTIVETAEEGILQVSADGVIRFANARMAAMFGIGVDRLLGRAVLDLVDPRQRATAAEMLATPPGRRASSELRLPQGDGPPCWVVAAAGSVAGVGGHGPEVVVMLTDISGRKVVEQDLRAVKQRLEARVAERTAELEMVNADLAAFNRTVAHDLRTPLGTIVGLSSLLRADTDEVLASRHLRHVELIESCALGMNDMLGGLLSLAGVTQHANTRQPLDLSALVQAIADRLAAAHPKRRAVWRIDAGVRGVGDPALVGLLLENLVANAWKYSARQAVAEIGFGRDDALSSDEESVYVVRDNGIGFEMASARSLFTLFQRLPSAAGFAGSGIGLATVRRIVDRHAGRVWAESQPGQGSRFYFSLGANRVGLQ